MWDMIMNCSIQGSQTSKICDIVLLKPTLVESPCCFKLHNIKMFKVIVNSNVILAIVLE